MPPPPHLVRLGRADRTRAGVPEEKWNDWKWQLRHMLSTATDFEGLFELSEKEQRGLAASPGLFRVGATPYYASLMDPEHPSCPIRMQAIPSDSELSIASHELRDPLGEDARSPAPSIFHKYPDRVLLYVFDRCAIYCRHCNRRRVVGGDSPPSRSDIDEGIDYIRRTPRIRDVLLSGGDPLLLSSGRLDSILEQLAAIDHVDFVRIGTRVPVVLPMRVDEELCQALRRHAPVYVNTHFNHAKELTQEANRACELLVDHGIPVGNQAVLLRGVNSSVRSLRALMRGLLKMRVRPYYLFQGDTVTGTDHLRTPVETAIELMDGMRGWMSGMAIPHLVLDAPGGLGKIPFGPQYVRSIGERNVSLRNYRGQDVSYPQPIERDCRVAYDSIFFHGVTKDDDRSGDDPSAA